MPTYRITARHMRDDLRNASFVEAASDSDAVKQVGRQLDDAHYYVVSCDHAARIIGNAVLSRVTTPLPHNLSAITSLTK